MCVCVCVGVGVGGCVGGWVRASLASDSSETTKIIIIKLGLVTASDRHDNAARVNYVDHDLHSRSHIS